jgi:GT2 family glycosyltransferase
VQSSQKNDPTVSIVILNYNGGEDVLECVKSVIQIDYSAFEIIVVDNGSTDDSILKIKNGYPQVRIIENKRNLGFAEGNNVGMRASTSDFILLLNDDTVVGKNMLKDLVEAIQADPKIGIAGPEILYYDSPERIWSAGGKIGLFGYAIHLGKGRKIKSSDQTLPVPYICGCAILIKREVVNKIGLLDSDYFAYFEDADYCFRANKAGYRSLYVPTPTVWHKVKPEWINNPVQAYYSMRNPFIFASKNLKGLRKFIFVTSQILLIFPFYSIKLICKDSNILKNLAKGLKDGLRYTPKNRS